MRRLIPLVLLAAAAAGCGSSRHAAATTTTPAPPKPAPGRVLYQGGPWAVVLDGDKAAALHLVGGRWQPDRSGKVKIAILGPNPVVHAQVPQVAAEMRGPGALVEEGLWVDGRELLEKGGGLSRSDVTVYGAPDTKLAPGRHVAVAYGRTANTGTAVAWSFRIVPS